MRLAVSLSLLLLVGACNAPGPTPLPTERVRARFPPHGIANVIEIETLTRLPLRRAALIGPDGTAIPASRLEANPSGSFAAYQWAANHPYAGMPAPGGAAQPSVPRISGAAAQSESRLLAVLSTASIPLPDPIAYRRDWRGSRIRLVFGSPPGPVETREIAAPKPLSSALPSD